MSGLARWKENRIRQEIYLGHLKTVGNVLIYLVGFALLAASGTKFAHLPPVIAQLTSAGFWG